MRYLHRLPNIATFLAMSRLAAHVVHHRKAGLPDLPGAQYVPQLRPVATPSPPSVSCSDVSARTLGPLYRVSLGHVWATPGSQTTRNRGKCLKTSRDA